MTELAKHTGPNATPLRCISATSGERRFEHLNTSKTLQACHGSPTTRDISGSAVILKRRNFRTRKQFMHGLVDHSLFFLGNLIFILNSL